MLKIRPEQLGLFFEYNKEKFIEKNLYVITSLYPEKTVGLSEDDLESKINTIIDRCIRYGITRDDHIMVFIGFALKWGENFDTEIPWCSKVLKWDAGPEEKIQALIFKFEKLQEEEWTVGS